MKKVMTLTALASLILAMQGCSTDDDPLNNSSSSQNSNTTTGTGGTTDSSTAASSGELLAFTVSIDKQSAEPATTVAEYFPEEEDNLDSNSFETVVNISLTDGRATYNNVEGVTITASGAHVVANHGSTTGVSYVVSGSTTNGSLTIVGDKKYEVVLSNADITNPDSTALNLLSKKRAYVVLADGTQNRLADGASSKAADQKAALYCKGKLLFNGTGSLEVYGNYNNGVHCADYIVTRKGSNIYVASTANNGIKANDGIYVNGGILNVEVSAAAAKGITCESNIVFNGGRTTVITTGNGIYEDSETKGAAAVKADSTITVNGGELWLKSTGSGGKAMKADWEAYVNGGTIYAITEGSKYTSGGDTSSPKGVKVGTKNVHGVLNIKGGTLLVRTSGNNGEGIESKGTLDISGGSVQVSAYDDAINSAGNMTISGGSVTAVGTNNDGLDANGNMLISGGTVVAFGASGAETGIDVGERNSLTISGGNIFGIGGRTDATLGSTSQGIIAATASVQAASTVAVGNGSTTLATFVMPPYSYNNGAMMLSVPGMTPGNSYSVSFGSATQTYTASGTISSTMGGGGFPGGGHGGR